MVLSTAELVSSLQHEVRVLQHLITKLDAATLDYRPTPSQRSARELVIYLSMMGPTIVEYTLAETPDIATWVDAENAAANRTFDEAVRIIGEHTARYGALLDGVSDAAYRSAFIDFDGNPTTRGAFLVNMVLSGSAAYRMQLFLYLKACGLPLTSANLWSGVDAPPA